MNLPPQTQQIIQAHAAFICEVVKLSQNETGKPELDNVLNSASSNGWQSLVKAVREVLAGQRDLALIKGLDKEDQVIAEAIMRGLQNPSTLPDPDAKPDPTLAGPGLAHMIHAAGRGDSQALILIGSMAEQMSNAGGDMALIASIIRPLINGERDADKLMNNLNINTEQLLLGILDELKKLDT